MSFSLHSRSGSTKSKTLNGPSHDEWLRQKEREKDDLAHLKMLKKKMIKQELFLIGFRIILNMLLLRMVWVVLFLGLQVVFVEKDTAIVKT